MHLHQTLHGHIILLIIGEYLGRKYVENMTGIYVTLKEVSKLFLNMVKPFSVPISSKQEFQLFPIFANTLVGDSLIICK